MQDDLLTKRDELEQCRNEVRQALLQVKAGRAWSVEKQQIEAHVVFLQNELRRKAVTLGDASTQTTSCDGCLAL